MYTSRKYPPELLERGVRMVQESERPTAHGARGLGVQRGRKRRTPMPDETAREWRVTWSTVTSPPPGA